ncbi:MAG: hypothetical protein LUG95_03355 [Clostridiales bacterium]|nr:hypothetical protein [Clostridiales bacterium]
MRNAKLVLKIYKEIFSLEKSALPCTVLNSVVGAVKPFVNVIIMAKIIDSITLGLGFKAVLSYIITAVILNMVLCFLEYNFDDFRQLENSKLGIKQNQKTANKLFP